jgi:hypothetical protein
MSAGIRADYSPAEVIDRAVFDVRSRSPSSRCRLGTHTRASGPVQWSGEPTAPACGISGRELKLFEDFPKGLRLRPGRRHQQAALEAPKGNV